jgi:hypothetical protein
MKLPTSDLIVLMNPIFHVIRNRQLLLQRRLSVIGWFLVLTWFPLTIFIAYWITRSNDSVSGFPDVALIGLLVIAAWISTVTYWAGKDRGLSEAQRLVTAEIEKQAEKHGS